MRVIDTVDVITGVSGGSFTALAFGLYGEKLFDNYEPRFLKRNVQGTLIARALNPFNWPALAPPVRAAPKSPPACTTRSCSMARRSTTQGGDGPRILAQRNGISPTDAPRLQPENFDMMCGESRTSPCPAPRLRPRRYRSSCRRSPSITTGARAATFRRGRISSSTIAESSPPCRAHGEAAAGARGLRRSRSPAVPAPRRRRRFGQRRNARRAGRSARNPSKRCMRRD